MPCKELFERQSQSYRDEVLSPDARVHVVVEMAASSRWDDIAPRALIVSVDTFGASGKASDVLGYFGFTVDRIVENVKTRLEGVLDEHVETV